MTNEFKTGQIITNQTWLLFKKQQHEFPTNVVNNINIKKRKKDSNANSALNFEGKETRLKKNNIKNGPVLSQNIKEQIFER